MRRILAFAVLISALGPPLFAQRTTGGISGTIRDASGSVLPGVAVAVSGPNVVGDQTTTTNEHGFYRILTLPPGEYQVVFTMAGFKTTTHRGVRVGLGANVEQNASLEISQLQESVDVNAEATRRGHDLERGRLELRPRVGGERAPAPLQLLRPRGGRPGRDAGRRRQHAHDDVRIRLRRERVPGGRRRHHGQLLQRGAGRAQHRRDRRGRDPRPGRSRRVRQHDGGGLQHRHPAGHERLPRRPRLLLPVRRPHLEQHEGPHEPRRDVHRRLLGRPALSLDPRALPGLLGTDRGPDRQGQALVLRLLRVPAGLLLGHRRRSLGTGERLHAQAESHRSLPGEALLADQLQAQAGGDVPLRQAPGGQRAGHRLDAQHRLVAADEDADAGPRVHRRALQQDRPRRPLLGVLRRTSPASPPTPARSRASPGSTTSTRASSPAGTTTGTSSTRGAPPPPPRSRTSPTTSWGRATTSSSACSTARGRRRASTATTTSSTPTSRRTPHTPSDTTGRPSATPGTARRSASSSTTPSR